MARHIRIAPRERTVRRQGLGPWSLDAAVPDGASAFGKGFAGPSKVVAVGPPPGLYIPAYGNNPDVGLTNPGILTNYTGSSTIPQGDYQDKIFDGQFTSYDASTFTNCKFIPNNSTSPGLGHCFLSRGGTSIFTDCEFGDPSRNCNRLIYSAGGSYHMIRCNLHHAQDGAKWAFGAQFTMCHIHDLIDTVHPDPHYDAIQCEGSQNSPAKVEFCHLDARRPDGVDGNGALFCKTDLPQTGGTGQHNMVVNNNYMNGGNYTFALRVNKYPITGVVVTNNIIGPDFRWGRTRISSGTYGIWTNNRDELGNLLNPGD